MTGSGAFEEAYQLDFTVASWETGAGGMMSPQALLRYLEEAAWQHAECGSLSMEKLADSGVFWGLVRQTVRFDGRIPRGEKLTVTTWHAGHDRVFFYRCFSVRDAAGRSVASAVSAWTMVDRMKRRMIRPSAAPVKVPDGDLGDLSDLRPEPLAPLAAPFDANADSIAAGFRDLDRNGHVNNVRYMEWFFDSLPSSLLSSSRLLLLTAEYRSEVFQGERLHRMAIPTPPGCFEHGLYRPDGKPVARARSTWEPEAFSGPGEKVL